MTDPSLIARQAILKAMLPIAAFDGWTAKACVRLFQRRIYLKAQMISIFPKGR